MRSQAISHDPIQNRPLSRRSLLTTGMWLTAGVALGAAACDTTRGSRAAGITPTGATTAASSPGLQRLSLPEPTGRYAVGTRTLHLVDRSRIDPLAPTRRNRELMVRLWYPAPTRRGPGAPYLSDGVSAVLVRQVNAQAGTDYPADLLTFPTDSFSGLPLARRRAPMVLFSPGEGFNAALYTGLLEELASRGYVVAGIDHTFDAVVEFPDGRVEIPPANPSEHYLLKTVLPVRVADVRFVLDQLTARFHPSAVVAAGHSLGSITTVRVIDQDRRIAAGVALDGNPLGSASLDRPFLMMGNKARHRRAVDPDWAGFYARLRGPRLWLVVEGVAHDDFSDLTIFKSMADLGPDLSGLLGPLDGARALHIERTYLTAWFDYILSRRPDRLLRGESPRFPEVDFEGAGVPVRRDALV